MLYALPDVSELNDTDVLTGLVAVLDGYPVRVTDNGLVEDMKFPFGDVRITLVPVVEIDAAFALSVSWYGVRS